MKKDKEGALKYLIHNISKNNPELSIE